ncbi:MAG TPA: ABC transporter permease [Candidatus Bathyarchaeia archaeon]|nr:ABC transporter permease [Candidatus Bathyarchaeia archaeon]
MTVKFVSLAVKGIKQALRDRRSLFFLLLFPVVFMVIFAFAFGSPSSLGTGTTPHKIAVINLDRGATASINNTAQHINAGANFTELLGNVTYAGTDTQMFTLTNVSADQAQTMLKSRGLDAAVTIPENFSQAIISLANASARTEATSDIGLRVINTSSAQAGALASQLPANATLPRQSNATAQVIVEGDTGSAAFGAAQGLIFNVLQQYQSQIQATAIRQVDATLGQNGSQVNATYVSAVVQPLTGARSFTYFDYQAPGLIVFALLLQVSSVAQDLAREADRGTLARLKMSNMRSFDLLFGTLLTWIVIAVVQILLLFGVALAVGFKWAGGSNSIALAVFIGIIGGIASISLGLLLAAFATNERQAAQLGVLIAIPVSFLTGAFFPLPNEPLGTAFGTSFQVYDLLPWTQVADAIRQVLVFGSSLSDVAIYVVFAIVLTAILFVIGVISYARVRLRSE